MEERDGKERESQRGRGALQGVMGRRRRAVVVLNRKVRQIWGEAKHRLLAF